MNSTSKRVLGYWHYGVILTYISVASAVAGICFAALGEPAWAVICLLLSGLCDAFDGTVAKRRRDRTTDDKMFGIQIDSFSDLLAFGVAPVMIGFGMGMHKWYYIAIFCLFVLCALVRLSHYNVMEGKRTVDPEGEARHSYEGMPVTSISLILPVFYLIATMFSRCTVTFVIMTVCYLIWGILFVLRFRTPKLRVKGILLLMLALLVVLTGLFLVRYFVCGIHRL